MKILHVIESLGRGGAERILATNLKWLNRDKFNSVVCSLMNETDFKGEIEANGVPVTTLGLQKKTDFNKGVIGLYQLIKRAKPDIIHTHLFFANIYGRIAARLANVKRVVTTLHNPDYGYEANPKMTFKARKFLDRNTGKFINTSFIAVSEAVKRDYVKWMGFKNINVLYNSIDLDKFRPEAHLDIQQIRKGLGFEKEDFILLNIGRLHPQKGQIYLIDAMRRLKDCRDVKFKLAIVGKGALRDELHMRIKRNGLKDRVYLMGKMENVKPIIQMADVFVFPSIYEAQGIAAIEAMALQKPVIATAVDGLTEVISDGEDGLLVKPADSEMLASAIMRLYTQPDLAKRLSLRARQTVEGRFDVRKNISQLENFYSELLN